MRRPVTQEELGTAAALLIIRSQFRHLIRMPPAHLLGEAFRAYPTGRRSQDMSERRHLLTALDMPLNPPTPKSWRRWLGRGNLGMVCSDCCPSMTQTSSRKVDTWNSFFPLNQEVCADESKCGPKYWLSQFCGHFKVKVQQKSIRNISTDIHIHQQDNDKVYQTAN